MQRGGMLSQWAAAGALSASSRAAAQVEGRAMLELFDPEVLYRLRAFGLRAGATKVEARRFMDGLFAAGRIDVFAAFNLLRGRGEPDRAAARRIWSACSADEC